MITMLTYALAAFALVGDTPTLQLPASNHPKHVVRIALSPDGRWLATGDYDGNVKVRDAVNRREHFAANLARKGTTNVSGLVWRDDGTQLYVATTHGFHVLDTATMEITSRIPVSGGQQAIGIPRDGGVLVAGIAGDDWILQRIVPWERTAEELWRAPRAQDPAYVQFLTLDPEGRTACVALSTGEAWLVEVFAASEKRAFARAEGVAGFLHDGRLLETRRDATDPKVAIVAWRDGRTGERLGERRFASTATWRRPVPFFGLAPDLPLPISTEQLRFLDGDKVSAPEPLPEGTVAMFAARGRRLGEWMLAYTVSDERQTHDVLFYDQLRKRVTERWASEVEPLSRVGAVDDPPRLHIAAGKSFEITWDAGGTRVRQHSGHSDTTLALPGGGRIELVGGVNAGIQFVDAQGRTQKKLELGTLRDPSHVLAATPRYAVVRDREKLSLVDVERQTLVWSHGLGDRPVFPPPAGGFAVNSSGTRVVVAGHDDDPKDKKREIQRATCFEIPSGNVLWRNTNRLRFLRFMPGQDGDPAAEELWAYDSLGQYFARYSAATGAEISKRWQGDAAYDHFSIYSADGRRSASRHGSEVRVRKVPELESIATLDCRGFEPTTMAFLPGDRHLVVGGNDGLARIFDIERATLVLGIAVLSTGEWAASTPDGRFEATEGAQRSMFFRRGADAFPLASLFEQYYTPRLVARVLSGEALPPPQVDLSRLDRPLTALLELEGIASTDDTDEDDIATRRTEAPEVTLRIGSAGGQGPAAELRLFHNGKRLESGTRGLTVEDDEPQEAGRRHFRTLRVALLPGANEFRLTALNAQRTESEPVTLRIERTGGAASERARLFLIAAGIDHYTNSKYDLNYAVADATAVHGALQRSGNALFSSVEAQLLVDAQVTRDGLDGAFQRVRDAAAPGDALLFYYAGHGVIDGSGGFHLVPHDVTQLHGDDAQLLAKGIATADLAAWSSGIAAQKQVFLLDACQSAGALEGLAQRGAASEKAIAQLARSSGTHWIAAAGSQQLASEFEKLGHGLFTYSLLEGLDGRADAGDGLVTIVELAAYLESRVPELAAEHRGSLQYPASFGSGQDFPIALTGQ